MSERHRDHILFKLKSMIFWCIRDKDDLKLTCSLSRVIESSLLPAVELYAYFSFDLSLVFLVDLL